MTEKVTFDAHLVGQLAALLNENDLNEIEFEENNRRIKVVRHSAPAVGAHPAAMMFPPQGMPVPAATAATGEPSVAAEAGDLSKHPGAVKSPMVGVTYLAPEPGAAPFVKVGDTVQAGQTLCIVEAMKVMNPIKAPKDGKVTHVLITDATPIEYDEVMFVIE